MTSPDVPHMPANDEALRRSRDQETAVEEWTADPGWSGLSLHHRHDGEQRHEFSGRLRPRRGGRGGPRLSDGPLSGMRPIAAESVVPLDTAKSLSQH